ncbi:hypothetical protein Skr01_74740 [Sphaerisporangium krabiense]|uniref:Uncharacterized protein n=1 Tax=Sphaerisporangium krabiense TaxID=763782 RepID=A0A7W9DPX4_9ACTN|nr:hypothetical protein [Sphaerisporangium krabiense]MBB5626813.1 hypothetical protein [Sphaerisporangium krabiense]GII67389.1 hypothetical protein Skr01_74740 [Sphaerisporangium krabiense]
MQPFLGRISAVTAATLTAFLVSAGCSGGTQECLDAGGIVTDTVQKATAASENPAAMEKALNDGAAKLAALGEKAGDDDLKKAAAEVAEKLKNLDVTNDDTAIKALEKLGTDSAKWASQLIDAC